MINGLLTNNSRISKLLMSQYYYAFDILVILLINYWLSMLLPIWGITQLIHLLKTCSVNAPLGKGRDMC